MSAPIGILLDSTRVRVCPLDARIPVLELPWDPAAPDDVVARLRDATGGPEACVLVVGLGFLEIARPELPPLSRAARRSVLLRDADRYFPTESAVAVAMLDEIAFAMPAELLGRWVTAFDTLAPVRAITTIAHAASRAVARNDTLTNAAVLTDGALGEHGRLSFSLGTLREARRIAGPPPATSVATRDLDAPLALREALGLIDDPDDAVLGDAKWSARVRSERRMRWLRSAALLSASLVALLWSAARWRERTLSALQQQESALVASTTPALQAQRRLARAASEQTLLSEHAGPAARPGEALPADVLARLGTLLPTDAFVQRIEWDGTLWKLDGSASNAPRIVPLLDADPHFQDVRIVAASTRFLDNGRQRESFSIAFRTRSASPSVQGTRNGQGNATR